MNNLTLGEHNKMRRIGKKQRNTKGTTLVKNNQLGWETKVDRGFTTQN